MNTTVQRTINIQPLNELEFLFEQALVLDFGNIGAHRGLGFIHWQQKRDLQALTEWQYSGLNSHDYVQLGRRTDSVAESLRWYNLAERLDPTNAELWLYIGQVCQRTPSVGPVCDRFLVYNGFNWLVDPEFIFGRLGWNFNRREGADYAIIPCPDIPEQKCALIQIDTVTSPYGTSWQQCLALEPERIYRYSVWLKVQTNGKWIPLYYQGAIKGVPNGYSVKGTHVGSEGWTYWEHDLTAAEFDNNRACFHPVRLLDTGQVWFHSPLLRLLQ